LEKGYQQKNGIFLENGYQQKSAIKISSYNHSGIFFDNLVQSLNVSSINRIGDILKYKKSLQLDVF